MNILHVTNISFVIPYFFGKQFSYFNDRGYKEYIVCSSSEELRRFAASYDFEFYEVEILRAISLRKDIKAVYKIAKCIRQSKADVVTGHTPKGALLSMIAAYIMHVPVRIYFRHGLVYETAKGFKRKLLLYMDRLSAQLATKVVCVSPSVYKRSLEDKLNIASKQILLSKGTCNGVDIERFNRDNLDCSRIERLKADLGLNRYSFIIGFTGRMVRDKGIIELVNAFKCLQVNHQNIALLLVGMLEERDALPENIVNEIKSNSSIIYTGYVENATIEYYYALMDIFILPSYREGFPTSVLEASAMKLPIITTRVTGCIDSIIEGETGLFVEHNIESIVEAIEKLYKSKCLRKSFSTNGRRFVEMNFEQHIIWEEIEKLYHNG